MYKVKFHWGTSILIFIILFVLLLMAFVIFSLNQHNYLVDDDYYNKGANYTCEMEIQKRSLIFTDSITLTNCNNYILVNVSKYIASQNNTFNLHFYNPMNKANDYITTVNINKTEIAISKTNIKQGRYIVKIRWENSKLEYKVNKNLIVQ